MQSTDMCYTALDGRKKKKKIKHTKKKKQLTQIKKGQQLFPHQYVDFYN